MDFHSAGLKREDLTKMHEGKGQFRILVVEDEAKVAGALREGLEREKYEVVVAPTGEEGFFLVSAEEFDLVLLDLMLPGRDGLQVLSTLRKRGLQTPVLVLTARDAIEDRELRRSEEHTSELQSRFDLVCRLLLEKKKKKK